jgi:glycosyltransferase involved in cell wall biosynthesis
LKIEIKQLAKADAIFCISREERWLLNQFGIKADFLPYYPPEPILSQLLTVRKARKHSVQNRFLILGTAHNPPTFLGMIKQIQDLQKIRQTTEFKVDIAGYGTEKLKQYCNRPSLIFHGTVESQKLNELLTNAKAVLIYQEAGVGALTRIPEMLIAGIPVIANGNACRSAFSYSGLYSYDDDDELAELMGKRLDIPSILPRPVAAEKRFISCLKKLAYQ